MQTADFSAPHLPGSGLQASGVGLNSMAHSLRPFLSSARKRFMGLRVSGFVAVLLWLLLPAAAIGAQLSAVTVANPNYDPNQVQVTFNQPVGSSAWDATNYRIDGNPAISAQPGTTPSEVLIETPTQEPGRPYTLTIGEGVRGADGSAPAGEENRTWRIDDGTEEVRIIGDKWLNVPGTQLADLVNNRRFPDNPDSTSTLSAFEIPTNSGDNYGMRVYGLFNPPVTGDYIFFISSDDQGALFVSTDANPANKVQVASEPIWNGPREFINGSNPGRGNPPTNRSYPIQLTADVPVFVEAQVKEGGGGDNLSVTAQIPGGSAVVNGSLPLGASSFSLQHRLHPDSGTKFYNFGPIVITDQPDAWSGVEGQPVTLRVAVDGSPRHLIQWMRNGEPVAGATASKLTFIAGAATAGSYTAVINNRFSSVTSEPAQVTVQVDTTPPTVVDVAGNEGLNEVLISFSEPVDPATATALSNYSLSDGLTVVSAALVKPDLVRLTTSRQADGAPYTVSVTGVKDTSLAGNPMAPVTKDFFGFTLVRGAIRFETWNGITSLAQAHSIIDADTPPNQMQFLTIPEYPKDGGNEGGENYGSQMTFWFTPPTSGNYVFFINSDDQSELYLSTDDNPANKEKLIDDSTWHDARDWTNPERRNPNDPENRSNPIPLNQGQEYYFEIRHHEGGGGDNVGATYKIESEPDPANGSPPRFQPSDIGVRLDPTDISISTIQHPANAAVLQGRSVVLKASAVGEYFSFRGTDVIPHLVYLEIRWETAPPGTDDWQPLPDSASSTEHTIGIRTELNTGPLTPADNGRKYRVVFSAGSVEAISEVATVTVLNDTQAPWVAEVVANSTASLQLTFDETIDPGSANQTAHYEVKALDGTIIPVVGAAVAGDQVNLTLGGTLIMGNSYVLTVKYARDPFGNQAEAQPVSFIPGFVWPLSDAIQGTGPLIGLDFNNVNSTTLVNRGTAPGLGIHVGPDGAPTPHPGATGADEAGFPGVGDGNSALELGGNNRVEFQGGSPIDNANALTVMALVKPGDMEEGEVYSILSQENTFALRWYDWDETDGVIKVEFNIRNGPFNGFVDGDLPADGQWHLIAGVWDGPSFKLLVDGVVVASKPGPISMSTLGVATSPIQVGLGNAYEKDVQPGVGRVDHVAIWNLGLPTNVIEGIQDAATADPSGQPPVVTVPSEITLQPGEAFEIDAEVSDSDTPAGELGVLVVGNTDMFVGALTTVGEGTNRKIMGSVGSTAGGEGNIIVYASDGRNIGRGEIAVTITVPENQPPVAHDDGGSLVNSNVARGNVLLNDSDPDGDPLRVTNTGDQPANFGRVVLEADGSYVYTRDGETSTAFHFLPGGFRYEITDGAATDHADVRIWRESGLLFRAFEDVPLTLPLGGVDPGGESWQTTIVEQPQHGTLTQEPGESWTFAPNQNYSGEDGFQFTLSSGLATSPPLGVRFTIAEVNDAPSFIKGADQTIKQDTGLQTVPGWATAISPGPANEPEQKLRFEVTAEPPAFFSTPPAVDSEGTLRYQPAPGARGTASVSVRLFDDGGTDNGGKNTSPPQTFSIVVQPLQSDLAVRVIPLDPGLAGNTPSSVTLVIENRGPEAANQVQAVLLTEHQVTSACPDGASCSATSPHILNFEVGSLPPTGVAQFTVPVQASGSGNGAGLIWTHVSTSSQDIELGNNQASVRLDVTEQPEPALETIRISQVTFDVDDDLGDDREGGVVKHSEFGIADIRYVPTADVMYFSAVANGQVVADNVPLFYSGGPGVGQPVEKKYTFRIRQNPGEPTVTIEWDHRVTHDPIDIWIPDAKPAPVAPQMACTRAGHQGHWVLYEPPPPPRRGGKVVDWAGIDGTFPNQPQGPFECAPATISNALNYLNSHFDLGLDPEALTLERLKAAIRWTNGLGAKNALAGDHWWAVLKDQYVQEHGLGIVTEYTTNLTVVLEALKQGHVVEADFIGKDRAGRPLGHTAPITRMGLVENGRYMLELSHDLYQDKRFSGAQAVETGIELNPTPVFLNGSLPVYPVSGTIWGSQVHLLAFVIERPVNVRPKVPNGVHSTIEDSEIGGVIPVDDHENDPVTFRIFTPPEHGRVVMNADGVFNYQPRSNYFGPDRFIVVANDGKQDSREATLTLDIAPVNDPPELDLLPDDGGAVTVPQDSRRHIIENFAHSIAGPENESDQSVIYLVEGAFPGDAFKTPPTITPEGRLTFELHPGVHGEFPVEVRARDSGDGTNESGPIRFTLVVTPDETLPLIEAPRVVDGKLRFEWGGGYILQQAPTPDGPWEDLPDAVSPFEITPTEDSAFFRFRTR